MLPLDTARPGRSVWDDMDRGTFENHVMALSRAKSVPDSRIHLEANWPEQRNQDLLPFAIERQLADDFAFIAAYEYGVRYVTAAAIEPSSEPSSLTVRLAANEGIDDGVKYAFEKLFRTLERCATKGKYTIFVSYRSLWAIVADGQQSYRASNAHKKLSISSSSLTETGSLDGWGLYGSGGRRMSLALLGAR